MLGNTYRPADPREESAGIDGFIGETPVSIKPTSYRAKASLPEEITGCIIWYKKVPDGIEVDYSELQSR